MRMLFGACVGLAALATVTASAQQNSTALPPAVTVEGSASASLTPDTAILSLGVVTTRATASDAVAANGAAVGRALTTLKADGIAADALKTSALELSAVMDEPKTGTPRVVGYRARNALEVRIPTSRDVGKLVGAVVDEGVDSVDGLVFTSGQEDATRDRLKGDAAKAARHDAEIYAAALGLRLGRVLGITPGAVPGRPYPAPMAMAARVASAPLPVEAGRLHVTEHVSVTFELVQ